MRFTESHEWIRMEGEIGVVGITAHAQKELGDIVFVELPRIGKVVRAAEETAVLESTKAASDVYAPVAGEIIAVNQNLKTSCASLNQSPEHDGWLYKLKVLNPSDADALMNQSEYTTSINPT